MGGRPTINAVRTSTPPAIDGRLDDVVWRDAVRITEFVQTSPVEGAPATETPKSTSRTTTATSTSAFTCTTPIPV